MKLPVRIWPCARAPCARTPCACAPARACAPCAPCSMEGARRENVAPRCFCHLRCTAIDRNAAGIPEVPSHTCDAPLMAMAPAAPAALRSSWLWCPRPQPSGPIQLRPWQCRSKSRSSSAQFYPTPIQTPRRTRAWLVAVPTARLLWGFEAVPGNVGMGAWDLQDTPQPLGGGAAAAKGHFG